MTALTLHLQGIGLLGPGLAGWAQAQAVMAGSAPYVPAATPMPPPQRLPAAERRRAAAAVRIGLAVAEEASAHAQLDPQSLATVFTLSHSDGANCHALCEMLAGPDRSISPTRFTNSVHNVVSGFWHIGVASQAASTSLCAYDASFGAGLVEAAVQLQVLRRPVLLVASECPYPEPLHAVRPLPESFGLAFVLSAEALPGSLARLQLDLEPAVGTQATPCREPALEALRQGIPAARGLPLLEALAQGRESTVAVDYQPSLRLNVRIAPA